MSQLILNFGAKIYFFRFKIHCCIGIAQVWVKDGFLRQNSNFAPKESVNFKFWRQNLYISFQNSVLISIAQAWVQDERRR